jgi:hypothetical protein
MTTRLYPNKGHQSCASCGEKLAPAAGYSWRDEHGWHSVCRSAACAADLGVATEGPAAPTTATAELVGQEIVVHTPPPWECKDDPRPLLRALPGSRWDSDAKAWRCSARDEDRATAATATTTARFDDETPEQRQARVDAIEAAARQIERDAHRTMAERVRDREIERAARHGHVTVKLTDARRDAIREAYAMMLGQCDGARRKDGVGFNKPDAAVAHKLSSFNLDDDVSLTALWLMLRRYPGQVSGFAALFDEEVE